MAESGKLGMLGLPAGSDWAPLHPRNVPLLLLPVSYRGGVHGTDEKDLWERFSLLDNVTE